MSRCERDCSSEFAPRLAEGRASACLLSSRRKPGLACSSRNARCQASHVSPCRGHECGSQWDSTSCQRVSRACASFKLPPPPPSRLPRLLPQFEASYPLRAACERQGRPLAVARQPLSVALPVAVSVVALQILALTLVPFALLV